MIQMKVLHNEVREFNAVDSKGRQIGLRALVLEKNLLSGTVYSFETQPLRNGVSYGGGAWHKNHATLDEAQKEVAKYFTKAEKKYLA
jgi:hypothetical protein